MFGKLKDKLKGALSLFSKKAEQEADIIEEVEVEKEVPVPEKKVEKITPVEKKEKKTEVLVKEKGVSKKEEVKLKDKVVEKKKEKKIEKKKEEIKLKEEKVKEAIQETKEETLIKEIIPTDQVKITYFVHGTTTDNETNISSGWKDVELSKLGTQQSKDLREKTKDHKFDVVFCSDLKRAQDSAKLTWNGMYQIIPDARLRECNYGKLNGASSDVVEPMQEEECIKKPFPEGESYEDVKRRISEFLNEVYDKYKGKRIAIVAHKASQLALDVILNGKTWEQALADDWRKRKAWQPGWEFILTGKVEIPELVPVKKGFFSKLKESFTKKETEQIKEVKPEVQKEEPVPKVKPTPFKEEPEEPIIEEKKSFFGKVKETLTTKKISADKFEELFWDLEIALLENNVSVEVIEKIKEDLKLELVDKPLPRDVSAKILGTLKNTLSEILTVEKVDLLEKMSSTQKKPFVIAFFGINGAGKTTSIAKLTKYLQNNHKSVVLAACDTFRAAAIQQLEEHAQNLNVKMIKHDYGSDAAAVAFDAIKYAEKNNVDVVLIDTAGRLHSNTNLMSELGKIIRVTKPDFNIFVGESITGNDCIEQARQFNELVQLDGVILTKADVDEKGGAPLSIAYTIKKPILFLGMGQKYGDLEKFEAEVILGRLGL